MAIENGADVATARRWYPWSLRSIHRQILSKVYIQLVRRLLRVPLSDTETGCKFFKRDRILPILDEIRASHWFWDTEIMVRSSLHGLSILEIPALYHWKPETGTTVRPWSDSWYYLRQLLRLRKEVRSIRQRG